MTTWLLALFLSAGPPKTAAPPRPGTAAPPPWDLVWMVAPPDPRPTTPPPAPTPELRALGQRLYQERCASCHGAEGDGRGPIAAKLRPRPTDFVRAIYKLRSTPAGTLPTDRDLFATLTRGVHGTAMQPWRRLGQDERWALVAKLKSFSPRFEKEGAGEPIPVPPAPHETDELQRRGAIVYIRLGCGACHGDTGEGDGPARAALDKNRGHAPVRNFTRGRFIRGIEMEDVFLTLRVGIAGTPMAAYDTLSNEDAWALAAYVRSLLRETPLETLPPARTTALKPSLPTP
jgi:mono/diheme cytochrome c family protein